MTRRRTTLVFGIGGAAVLACLLPLSARPRCDDHGMYVACFGSEGGQLRVEVRNRSSRPLVLWTSRFAYRVRILGLRGYEPTQYDIDQDATRSELRLAGPQDPENFAQVGPGGSYALRLPAYGLDDSSPLPPLTPYTLELREERSTPSLLPAHLAVYPLLDLKTGPARR